MCFLLDGFFMEEVLRKLSKGEISLEEALKALKLFTVEHVYEIARVDIGREFRRGVPEIILAEGKDLEALLEICQKTIEKTDRIIVSRADRQIMDKFVDFFSEKGVIVEIYDKARMIILRRKDVKYKHGGCVGVITAGTADIPIAEEARLVAEEMGCKVHKAYDVGIAGLHRAFEALKEMLLNDVDVIVAIAGREGALPSIIASLVDVPVIGVPTSQGYGFGGGGLAALQAMLQACPLGLAVVNIDSGVAAGVVAALIANRVARKVESREKL